MHSGEFIAETLDSVAALTTPHEHIVFEGGSTDNTVEILEARDDDDLIWASEPDRGQTHAVNKGLDLARGELLGWLNADDAYVSHQVDAAVERMLADPGIHAVFGFLDVIDGAGRFQRQYRCGPFNWHRYLYAGDYVATPTIIFRRSLLKQTGKLDEAYADAADYEFYLRLLRAANVVLIRESLVRFRFHEQSKTASNVALQNREAMEIRFKYTSNPLQRALMRGIRRVKSVRERIAPPWPDPGA